MKDLATIIGGCLGCLLILVVAFGASALVAWITCLVVASFGYQLGFWQAFGIWFLLSCFVGLFTRNKK